MNGQPGPMITLERITGVLNTEFVLLNGGEESAFNVKIESIVRANGVAEFEIIPIVSRGSPISVKPSIRVLGPLFQHAFWVLLRREWGQKGSTGYATVPPSIKVPVTIVYENIEGQKFESQAEIEYHFERKTAVVYHKRYGRKHRNPYVAVMEFLRGKLFPRHSQ